ncbi:MAG: endonuclease/exonuclease/phosphatase family protein [Propionibacteriaceae bacterium]|jgi:endonuclease/exonuclease/phosphatase family metal-dependent hydrolase|nr:endonuclease/exonuclease/phosphatase family protein [Propionibacteriaceae bacterium]
MISPEKNANETPTTMTLRVLTLNVEGIEGDESRQADLRNAIAAINPDLLSLQEVVRNDSYDQLSQLLGDTGLIGVHDLDLINTQSAGTALATRWPASQVVGQLLPGHPLMPSPNALAAVIPLPIGVNVLFMAVKPYWPLNGEALRCRDALAITELESTLRQAAPAIIAGDFDAVPTADCMQFFAGRRVLDGRSTHYLNAWDVAGDGGPGYTWTTENPGVTKFIDSGLIESGHARRIDHILVHGPEGHVIVWGEDKLKVEQRVRAVITSCEVVFREPPVSDHYGVLAEIELSRVEP